MTSFANKEYILADRQYSIQQFIEIKNTLEEFHFDQNIINIINDIARKVGAPTYQKTPVFKKSRNRKKNDISSTDWENLRNFKKTTLIIKIGLDAEIDKIRSSLNKLTKQNYKTMFNSIMTIIHTVMSETNDANSEFIMKISNIIFDIGSTNKYMSLYYAKIYKDIIDIYSNVRSYIDINISKYKSSLDDIKFVCAEENYDLFCENNKKNETIRSTGKFIVDLMNENIIESDIIIHLIHLLENKINDNINMENKKDECEEIFENLRILLVNSYEKLQYNVEWSNIINNIKQISGMKSKDFISLSNKMIFKCSDILEELDEDD
jgi:hypothetical protein